MDHSPIALQFILLQFVAQFTPWQSPANVGNPLGPPNNDIRAGRYPLRKTGGRSTGIASSWSAACDL
jgi:hypothetical protein